MYGIEKKDILKILIGFFIVSLKPALTIPLTIYLLISGKFKLFISIIAVNLVMILIVSIRVDTSAYDLLKQLQETQNIFANNGFYRWEGIFLIIKDHIGNRMSAIGVLFSFIFLALFKSRIEQNSINIYIAVVIISLSAFYNQEHSWSMVFPILAYSLHLLIVKNEHNLIVPSIFIILFMTVPSMYIIVESNGFTNYMAYHNLIRFSLLIICSCWVITIGNKLYFNNIKFVR